MSSSLIQYRPSSERPRERCVEYGPECLSLRECLAVLLGTGPQGKGALGLAEDLLMEFSGEEELFFQRVIREKEDQGLAHLKGLGTAKWSRILAAFEIARRYALFCLKENRETSFSESRSCHHQALLKIPDHARADTHEWIGFVPVAMDRKVGKWVRVERGVNHRVNFDPGKFFFRLLAFNPMGFFLFHNHPSGVLIPSAEDEHLTKQIRSLAEKLGMTLLGHGIVSSGGVQWIDLNPCFSSPQQRH